MKDDFDRLLGPVKAYIERTSRERKELSKLKKISLKELKSIRNLGQGTFGLVKLVQFEKQHFALKCLQKEADSEIQFSGQYLVRKTYDGRE